MYLEFIQRRVTFEKGFTGLKGRRLESTNTLFTYYIYIYEAELIFAQNFSSLPPKKDVYSIRGDIVG